MNIFILDADISKNAEALCDKHVVKMVLETAQLLCGVYENGKAPYKRTHYNHPCSIWTRTSLENFDWLVNYGFALCKEYTHRYGKIHKSEEVIQWCSLNKPNLDSNGLTAFAQAMPDVYRRSDPIEAYRGYYCNSKRDIATWNKNRSKPDWF